MSLPLEQVRAIGNEETFSGLIGNWLSSTGSWNPRHELEFNTLLRFKGDEAEIERFRKNEWNGHDLQLRQL